MTTTSSELFAHQTIGAVTFVLLSGIFETSSPRYAMLARLLALSESVSVCLSQAGVVPKRMDGSSWFLAQRFPLTYPICLCCKKILASPKYRYFSLDWLQGFPADCLPILLSLGLSIFLLFSFFPFLVVGSVRYLKLAYVSFWPHVKIASRIVSYGSLSQTVYWKVCHGTSIVAKCC